MSDPLNPEEEADLRSLVEWSIPLTLIDVRRLLATLDAARAVPAGLDVEGLAEAVFRVGTGHRNRDLALIHPRIANSQDGAKASREFAEAVAREYDHLRRRQGERP